MQNNEFTSYLAGKVHVAEVPSWIPAYIAGTNDSDVMSYIEANASFTRLWWVQWLEIVQDYWAQTANIRWDECDYIETKYSKPNINVNFDWLENINPDAISIISNVAIQNVAWTLVSWATQIINTPFTANLFYPIENQNWDKSEITINSVTWWTDWALTGDDDYHLVKQNWVYGIILNTVSWWTNISTLSQIITIDYDYTPNTAKNIWLKKTTLQLPNLIVKIEWCPNSDGIKNTHYLVNASIDWTITQWFVDLAESWEPVSSPISFITNTWWYLVSNIDRWVS